MLINGVNVETQSFRRLAGRIGKIAASVIVGVALLPQVAHAQSYAGSALSLNPVAFWQFTETANPSAGGVQALDSSGNGFHGTYGINAQNVSSGINSPQPPLYTGFTNQQGAFQSAPTDAASVVTIPPLNLITNTVTITTWIWPAGNESVSSGLLVHRSTAGGNDAAGLAFGPTATLNANGMPALGYVWNTNAAATWQWNSHLYPEVGKWNFVALVINSNSATMYLFVTDGFTYTNLYSAVNPIAHTVEAWNNGTTYIAGDTADGGGATVLTARVYQGIVSDTAVYDKALSADQILSLYASGLGASGFAPSLAQQPISQYVLAGHQAQFSASGINGTSPISLQWQLNGTNVNLLSDAANFIGANSNVLTVVNPQAIDAGSYQLVLNNSVGTTLSSNAVLTIQATNLVGQWLDGTTNGTNLLNVSGYVTATNHGAYFTGVGNYVFTNDVPPGKTGQSLFLFNGDTGVVISNSSTLDPNYDDTYDNRIASAVTVSCWAKGWPGNWNPFVSKYGETTPLPQGGFQLRGDAANHPTWTLRGAGGTTNGLALGQQDGGNPDDLSAPTLTFTAADNVWHFYTGTYDAGTGLRNLYVDGQLVASETNLTAYTVASLQHLCIGARDTNGVTIPANTMFTGEIFDVRVYNYSLPLPAVQSLYGVVPGSPGTQPKSVVTFTNSTVQFTTSGAGTAPLSYNWTLNGTNIGFLADATNFTGATSNTLTILHVTPLDIGSYRVSVSNLYGGAVSSNATLSVVPKALFGQWFNGNAGLQDLSGYQAAGVHDGYDLGASGGSFWFTNDVPPGKTGTAIHLQADGIGIFNTSTNEPGYTNTFDTQIGNTMTVSFWARGYPGNWNPWVSKYGDSGTAPTAGWQFRDSGNNSAPCFTVRGAGGTIAQGTGSVDDNRANLLPTNDGQWHHYAGTFSASTGIRIAYVDGVRGAMVTNTHAYLQVPDCRLAIGARDAHGTLGNYFTGNIYDVRIYNYDLSSNEVAALAVIPDPFILSQPPAAITAYVGVARSIYGVSAKGYSTLTNHWQISGTNLVDGPILGGFISGSTSNVLTITATTLDLQGVTFTDLISDAGGSVATTGTLLAAILPTTTAPGGTNIIGSWLTGAPTLADVSGYSPAGVHDGYGISGVNTGTTNYGFFTNDVPPGMTGQSLRLNGSAGIAISNSATADLGYTNTFDDIITNGGGFTVTVWARGIPGQWNPWVSKYGESTATVPPGTGGWQLRRGQFAADPTFTIRGTGTGAIDDMQSPSTTTISSAWHNYTGTWNATTGERDVYMDGILLASQIDPNPPTYAMSPISHLALGARDAGGAAFGNYFNGTLYGVRIYNTALSGAQVNSLLLSTNVVTTPGFGSAVRSGSQLVLTWTNGTLQSATNVLGPWTSTGATSPYTNDMSTNVQRYFRVSNP